MWVVISYLISYLFRLLWGAVAVRAPNKGVCAFFSLSNLTSHHAKILDLRVTKQHLDGNRWGSRQVMGLGVRHQPPPALLTPTSRYNDSLVLFLAGTRSPPTSNTNESITTRWCAFHLAPDPPHSPAASCPFLTPTSRLTSRWCVFILAPDPHNCQRVIATRWCAFHLAPNPPHSSATSRPFLTPTSRLTTRWCTFLLAPDPHSHSPATSCPFHAPTSRLTTRWCAFLLAPDPHNCQ